MKFNWLDIVFMALALRGLIVGIRRGILGELVQTLIILAAILMAVFLSPSVATVINSFLPFGIVLSNGVTAGIVVVTGVALAFLLGKIVQKLSHVFIQSGFDKVVGGFLGIARAFLLTAVFLSFMVLSGSAFFQKHVWESVIGLFAHGHVSKAYDYIKEKIPSRQIEQIEKQVEQVAEDEASTQSEE